MDFVGLTLLIPEKGDEERGAVAAAWVEGGGEVLSLGRFWEPPALAREAVKLYGNDTFCLVLEQKLGLKLVSPPDDLLVRVDEVWRKRAVACLSLAEACGGEFPRFVKPLVPKVFTAAVYEGAEALRAECVGLDEGMPVLVSDVVRVTAEARAFVLEGRVVTCAIYEGGGDVNAAEEFLGEFLAANGALLPSACVLDVGRLADGEWALIEANAAWGSGLNGCDARAAARCVARATEGEG